MPGFSIQRIGDSTAPADDVSAYYTYTWDIQSIFANTGLPKTPLIYLKDMSLPTFSVGTEQVKGASLTYKYASDVTWEDVKVTWYDTAGMLSYLQKWRAMVWTPEGGLQPPTSYKSDTVLTTSLPDGSSINTWTLKNSWPSTIRYGDLTYTQSDAKVVDVTISYDWAIESDGS